MLSASWETKRRAITALWQPGNHSCPPDSAQSSSLLGSRKRAATFPSKLSVFSHWFSYLGKKAIFFGNILDLFWFGSFFPLLLIVICLSFKPWHLLRAQTFPWAGIHCDLQCHQSCNWLVSTRCRLSHTRKEDKSLHSPQRSIQSGTLELQQLHSDFFVPLICFKIFELIFHKLLQGPPLPLLELHSILPL